MANDVALVAQHDANQRLDARSIELRRLAVRALDGGARGHIGSSMSLIEIMRVLYDDILRYRADAPDWEGRDRCILSKGHGCIAQYVMLAEKGFFPLEVLDSFCRRDSILGGHPEAGKVPGVEASTGALGHGLPIGVGRAMGLRIKNNDARVFVVTGDGEINEGSVWEAALSASKHGLSNLTWMVDYNKVQSAGPTAEILPLEPLADKLRAFGFAVAEVDGHDIGRCAGCCARCRSTGSGPMRSSAIRSRGRASPSPRTTPTGTISRASTRSWSASCTTRWGCVDAPGLRRQGV